MVHVRLGLQIHMGLWDHIFEEIPSKRRSGRVWGFRGSETTSMHSFILWEAAASSVEDVVGDGFFCPERVLFREIGYLGERGREHES